MLYHNVFYKMHQKTGATGKVLGVLVKEMWDLTLLWLNQALDCASSWGQPAHNYTVCCNAFKAFWTK